MVRKLLVITVIGSLMVPVAAAGAVRERSERKTTMCVPLPVATSAKDIHVGSQHYHVPGRTELKVCVKVDADVQGTPTVTPYSNCGNVCFAVRVSDVRAYSDVGVELSWKEDGEPKSVPVDPPPVDLTRDVDEVCISNHDAGTPDPCVITILSPSDLQAQGEQRQVALTWSAAKESYGRQLDLSYEIWRNTDEELEGFEQIATSTTTRFVDMGLARRTTYWYFVVAVDEEGRRSAGSNLAAATTN